jgi:hypothetical protein
MQPVTVGWVRRGFLRRNPPKTHVGFRSAALNLRINGHFILLCCTKHYQWVAFSQKSIFLLPILCSG